MAILLKKKYVAHPAGMFDFVLVSIDEHTITTKDGDKDGYNVLLRTDEGDIIPWVSDTYSEKSNLGKLVKACLGSLPDALDTDNLAGKVGQIVVVHELKGDMTVDKIISYLPPKGAGDLFAGQQG